MGADAIAFFVALCLVGLLYRVEKRNAALNRRIRRHAGAGYGSPRRVLSSLTDQLRLPHRTPDWLRDRGSKWVAAGVFLVAAAAIWLFTHEWWLIPPGASLAAGTTVYYRSVMRKRAIRKQFLADFPNAVDGLTRLVVVGVSVEAALGEMGQYFSEPVRGRFEEVGDQLELGVPFDTVMRKLSADLDIPELEFFCTVLIINRETGGHISDVLARLSRGIRMRSNAGRQLEILTSEPRASAKVVALIPLALIGVQAVVNPAGFQFLLNDPDGRMVLTYAVVSILLGLVIVRRMTRFD